MYMVLSSLICDVPELVIVGRGRHLMNHPNIDMSLYDQRGQRKYLTASEGLRFWEVAEAALMPRRLFALTLFHTGCRISEAVELQGYRVDLDAEMVTFRSLKKRGRVEFRSIPVPSDYLDRMAEHFDLPNNQQYLWPINRRTGYRWIKEIMALAEIEGSHATPRGLRHGFGIACAEENIPIATVKNWMGHADIKTTLIYQQALGSEERAFAERLWNRRKKINSTC
jgi:integrase